MIAAWCQKQVLAPCTYQGYCDSLLVETWFEKCLLPVLKKGQVVILDNASFHRQAPLRALLQRVGCESDASCCLCRLTRPTSTKSSRFGTHSNEKSKKTTETTLTSGTKSTPLSAAYNRLSAIVFPIQSKNLHCTFRGGGFCFIEYSNSPPQLPAARYYSSKCAA